MSIPLLPYKIFLSVVLYVLVLGPYRLAQEFPIYEAYKLEDSWIDKLIPFTPDLSWLYLSLLLFMPFAVLWVQRLKILYIYTFGVLIQSFVANTLFFLVPTATPRRDYSCGNCLYDVILFFDSSVRNSAPSLHASLAVFTCLWATRNSSDSNARVYYLMLLFTWCGGILYATIAIRQHVFFDILSGGFLGAFAYSAAPRLVNTFSRKGST